MKHIYDIDKDANEGSLIHTAEFHAASVESIWWLHMSVNGSLSHSAMQREMLEWKRHTATAHHLSSGVGDDALLKCRAFWTFFGLPQ